MRTCNLLAAASLVGFLASYGQVAQAQHLVTLTSPAVNSGLPFTPNLVNIDITLNWTAMDQPVIATTVQFDIVKRYPAPNNTTYYIITTSTGTLSSLGPKPGQPYSAQFTQSIGTMQK